ncbi:MAG: hypothetical protein JNM93_11235 [Bacteriovoracaceae bacterium]|nr:hypothetical protein [Bacteriovoracaceae bacterium]
MKILGLLTILISLSAWSKAPNKFTYPEDENIFAAEQVSEKQAQLAQINDKIGQVKYSLLIGNLERAKLEIFKLKDLGLNKDFLPLIDRYHAIVFFLEENYMESLKILSSPIFKTSENYKKICHLKVLNKVILNIKKDLFEDWNDCKGATMSESESDHLWFDALVKVKLNSSEDVTARPFESLVSLDYSVERTRVWLKLALYLNQFKFIRPYISQIPTEILSDEDVREAIGFLYFRENDLVKSYRFIEDLDGANVENIKGNFYLMQEKWDLAYAQYKLAIMKKSNSINALERLLPLTWLLEQWQEGEKLSEEMKFHAIGTQNERTTLKAAFLVQLDKFDEAREHLNAVIKRTEGAQELEVNQIYAYASLRKKQNEDYQRYSARACDQLDGLSCWVMIQSRFWDDLTQTVHLDQAVHEGSQAFIDNLTQTASLSAIEETLFVDQRDIEELDNTLIKLKAY